MTEPVWRKSSHSNGSGECVEVAFYDTGNIGVRDSKDQTGPALSFTPSEWDAFVGSISAGELHQP